MSTLQVDKKYVKTYYHILISVQIAKFLVSDTIGGTGIQQVC